MNNFFLLLLSLFCLLGGLAYADDDGFRNDSKGILERLDVENWNPTLSRSGGGGDYPLTAVFQERGVSVERVIAAPASWDNPNVNLIIEFDSGSCRIRKESEVLLKELALALGDDSLKGRKIQIVGHCDSDGTDEYNLRLSLGRSLSVCKYLKNVQGSETVMLKPVGYGEGYPLYPNTSEAYKQKNRRVEIVVIR